MTDCRPGNIAKTSLTRATPLQARLSDRMRSSGTCAAWISPLATRSADRYPTRWSRGVSNGLIAALTLRAQPVQDRLDPGVGFQHCGPHQLAEFAPGLAQPVTCRLHRGISHRLFSCRSQLRAVFLA